MQTTEESRKSGKGKNVPQGWGTAAQAKEILQLSDSQFYAIAKKGLFERIKLPGRSEFYYRIDGQRGVRAYLRTVNAMLDLYVEEQENITFDLALRDDVPEIYRLVSQVCGGPEHALPQEIMLAWMRINQQSVFVLRKGEKIVSYASMLPLSWKGIEGRATKRYMNRSIPFEEIGDYTSNTSIHLYIAELATTNFDVSLQQQRFYSMRMISELFAFALRLLDRKIRIEGLYAIATSPDGIRMCKKIGMKPLAYPEGTTLERIPYGVTIEEVEPKYLLLQEYVRHLEV
jgi:hypothetical protein